MKVNDFGDIVIKKNILVLIVKTIVKQSFIVDNSDYFKTFDL